MVRWPPPTNTVRVRCRPTGAPERRRSAYFVVSSASAIVTSTSTPDSMGIDVICFTTSDGEWRSMTRLWMRISKRSHELVPSPQGDLRVVMRSFFVGMRTGPLTFNFLSTAPLLRLAQTVSSALTSRDVSVMRMRWTVSVSRLLVFSAACFSSSSRVADMVATTVWLLRTSVWLLRRSCGLARGDFSCLFW
ncbi:unnamed protein product [Pelagomonas calceolata]|uniref:Uncharacterized protein n=1 Tax=Pelagomonas calceolata TaxID=35677 RepID=A0A8J2WVA7_9STRA|nr:unnamed protein product [Pelagomonas calceolata]